jgi:hypothetical protein
MPNWCQNKLELTHPDKAILLKAIKAWNEGKFLSTLVPEPDYTQTVVFPTFPDIRGNNNPVDPGSAWWDWRVQNWGCKWELDTAADKIPEDATSINVTFDSPWSPPIKAYQTLTEQGFDIQAMFFESGMSFCGRYTSESGEAYFNIQGNADWVCDNIPSDINDEFAIADRLEDAFTELQVNDVLRRVDKRLYAIGREPFIGSANER